MKPRADIARVALVVNDAADFPRTRGARLGGCSAANAGLEPPWSVGARQLLDAERFVYRLPKPQRDGTTALTLIPLELINISRHSSRRPGGTAIATMACSRRTHRCGRLPSASAVRWRMQPAHRPNSAHRIGRRPPMPAPRRSISGSCCWPGCSNPCRWYVPTAVRTCASSRSSPKPSPSSASSPTSVSRHAHRRSRPRAAPPAWDDAPRADAGLRPPPTARVRLRARSAHRVVAAVSRRIRRCPSRLAVARCTADLISPHPPHPPQRRRLHCPDARQPGCSVLTTYPAPDNVSLRAKLDSQGRYGFPIRLRVVVRVIHVSRIVGIVADHMFPETALPDAPLTV
ncbi:hypothetical protein Thivi_1462 [Thiocystis violascens DSM 198]|uniref:Uncharacterized protein n=1 Tax=Thiocystis violascens (strain ATCC 17096 / DSM 198 / 6111) TaxID=765911 RepID=I3Y8Z9_THIV6|nr:hypothetical protein Thivi_1462 [Thiocystis violascens DSM 198]